jgi:hypothetical protein
MDTIPINSRIASSAMVGLIKSNSVAITIVPLLSDGVWDGNFDLRCKGVEDSSEGREFLKALLLRSIDNIEGHNG